MSLHVALAEISRACAADGPRLWTNKREEKLSRYANYECLKVEVAEKVATVTLNRPQARNAINQKLIPSCGRFGTSRR